MTNKIKYMAVALALGLTSCNDWLDPNEYALKQRDQIYEVTHRLREVASGIYGSIPQQTDLGMSAATDEGELVDNTASLQQFNGGNWNKYNNADDVWSQCYTGIRIAMDVLEESSKQTWSDWQYSNPTRYVELIRDLNTVRAEARFLSAYLYFELFKRYGDVPLITEKLDINIDMDYTQYQRRPVSEIIDYISEQCDIVCREGKWYMSEEEMAAQTDNGKHLLPIPYRDTLATAYPLSGELSSYLGRATKASAYALKAKALVYFASKTFNPENDIERWKNAAAACYKVLSLPKSSYALETNYADLFQKKANWSKEFLFVRKAGASNSFEKANYPVSIEGGSTGMCPSQNLVDAYEVVTYDENGVAVSARKFDWNNEVDKNAPFANRDPRMYATVYTHGEQYNSTVNTIVLDCSEGGNSGLPIYHATKTGYYLKKYISPGLDLKNNKTDPKTWILMRLADFYLYYAEAMNEAYGPNDPADYGMTALEALNTVRRRAGMPDATAKNQDEMREIIYHERQVELAFENQRWWDVRRWQYGQAFNQELRGLKITKDGTKETYEPIAVEERVFDESKMYLYPIPQSEIDKGHLEQNVNW